MRFDRVHPHSIVTVEEKTNTGSTRRWAVEGPDPGRLGGQGIPLDFLKAGDIVRFEFAFLNPPAELVTGSHG